MRSGTAIYGEPSDYQKVKNRRKSRKNEMILCPVCKEYMMSSRRNAFGMCIQCIKRLSLSKSDFDAEYARILARKLVNGEKFVVVLDEFWYM